MNNENSIFSNSPTSHLTKVQRPAFLTELETKHKSAKKSWRNIHPVPMIDLKGITDKATTEKLNSKSVENLKMQS